MRGLLAAGLFALFGAHAHAELSIELTPERVERGEYLALVEIGCSGCHSERERFRYGFPPKESGILAGGVVFAEVGENAISPNLTPYGLGSWSDQEIFDAITRGIRPDGRVLDPHMPYKRYGLMEKEVIYSVIAYLRSIEPIPAGPYPAVFPGEHVPFEPQFGTLKRPEVSASEEELGAYLVGAAGCNGCHYGNGEGGVDRALLAGGREFGGAGVGIMRAANLTPDQETGIGSWSRDAFLTRFAAMREAGNMTVALGQPNTTMHWWQYGNMAASDLSAIYAYLRTIPPVHNSVVRFESVPGKARVSLNWSERAGVSQSSE
jgi:hypothetical protein